MHTVQNKNLYHNQHGYYGRINKINLISIVSIAYDIDNQTSKTSFTYVEGGEQLKWQLKIFSTDYKIWLLQKLKA